MDPIPLGTRLRLPGTIAPTSLAIVALLAFLVAPGARAALRPYQGTLQLSLSNQFPVAVSATGIAEVGGTGLHLTSLGLPAGAFSGSVVTPVTDPAAAPIQGFELQVGNGAGSVAETSGGALAGVLPLAGLWRFCLFAPCSAPLANVSVPLSPVGVGGSATVTGQVGVTVVGAPWTTGTVTARASYPAVTGMGFRHGPASLASSTAGPSGALQLVTPIWIRTTINPGITLPGIATLTLHFVPEPGTGALLALALAGLCARGRLAFRRLRRSG